jgi:hypothetical protein
MMRLPAQIRIMWAGRWIFLNFSRLELAEECRISGAGLCFVVGVTRVGSREVERAERVFVVNPWAIPVDMMVVG